MAIKDKKIKETKDLYKEYVLTNLNTEEKKLIAEILRRLSIVEGELNKIRTTKK